MEIPFKDADGHAARCNGRRQLRALARDLAQIEDAPENGKKAFYEALEDFKFLPAGRITARCPAAARPS